MIILLPLLAGCTGSAATLPQASQSSADTPRSPLTSPLSTPSIYPVPGVNYAPPVYGYRPQAGDDVFTRGTVAIDYGASQVIGSYLKPASAVAFLHGTLPDACHVLRVAVAPPDVNNVIALEAYSVYNPNDTCPAVEAPFSEAIYLENYSAWQYSVMVNGESLYDMAAAYAPRVGDDLSGRAGTALDLQAINLADTDTLIRYPAVSLQGTLPDTCSTLRITLTPDSDAYNVHLQVYSVVDLNTSCTIEAQPFSVIYPLAGAQFTNVYVNGEFIGQFQWGG